MSAKARAHRTIPSKAGYRNMIVLRAMLVGERRLLSAGLE